MYTNIAVLCHVYEISAMLYMCAQILIGIRIYPIYPRDTRKPWLSRGFEIYILGFLAFKQQTITLLYGTVPYGRGMRLAPIS